jgi:hypothetical protein
MSATKIDPDANIWGAEAIAIAANVVDENGKPDLNAAYYLLKRKLLPANKVGKKYVSTLRRLRAVGSGEASKAVAT